MNTSPLFRRYGWHLTWIFVAFFGMLVSVSAFADTYNFFFQKKGKKGQTEATAPVEESDASRDDEDAAEEPAPKKKTAEASESLKTTSKGEPIIINNYNNNTNTNTAAPAAKVEAPVEETAAAGELEAEVSIPRIRYSARKATVGVTSLLMANEGEIGGTLHWGGNLSLGLRASDYFGINLYGGSRLRSGDLKFHAGTEAEIYLLRIPVRTGWNMFEVAALFGGSTAAAARGNIGSFHTGARANINLSDSFAITAVSRINLGMLSFEAGLVTRL